MDARRFACGLGCKGVSSAPSLLEFTILYSHAVPCFGYMSNTDYLLPISFNLAAEIGLEESVLLSFLRQRAFLTGAGEMFLSHRDIGNMLPFWTMPMVLRLLASLQASQLLQYRRTDQGIAVQTSPASGVTSELTEPPAQSKAHEEDVLAKVSRLQHSAKAAPQVQTPLPPSKPAFSPRERSYPAPQPIASSGERRGVSDFDRYLEEKERTRQPDQWLPEESTFEQILQSGIERSFAQQLLPEFLLRIKEQRKNVRTWNSEFFKYVKRQWQYRQSDRGNYEGSSTYSTTAKSNREEVRDAIRNIHDTDW